MASPQSNTYSPHLLFLSFNPGRVSPLNHHKHVKKIHTISPVSWCVSKGKNWRKKSSKCSRRQWKTYWQSQLSSNMQIKTSTSTKHIDWANTPPLRKKQNKKTKTQGSPEWSSTYSTFHSWTHKWLSHRSYLKPVMQLSRFSADYSNVKKPQRSTYK